MVSPNQIEKGLASYLDSQFMTKLPKSGVQRIIIGTAASIFIRRISNMIITLEELPIISALDLIDDDGNVDIDIISEELKKQIPDDGMCFDLHNFGGNMSMTFRKEDIDEITRYIEGRSPGLVVPSNTGLMKGGMR